MTDLIAQSLTPGKTAPAGSQPGAPRVVPISHRALVQEMNAFAKSSTWRGLALFIGDFSLYWAGVLGVIFFPSCG